MQKINLGCRNNILEGYINIDLEDLKFPVDGVTTTDTSYLRINALDIDKYFRAETIDEILAVHFFEHLTHQQITVLLYKLFCLLKPKGILTIVTPDFYNLINTYQKKQALNKDFSDADILHIKVFDTEEETYHKTVWYEEIGVYYLEREHFFKVTVVGHASPIEIKFIAQKI